MIAFQVLVFLLSLWGLIYFSDKFVDSVVVIAQRFRISTMVIGMTIVAVGTSLPEVASSVVATLREHPTIAVGNVVGSNICNVGLILGLSALVAPVVCGKATLFREGLIMVAVSAALYLLVIFTPEIGYPLSLAFLAGFAAFIFIALRSSLTRSEENAVEVATVLRNEARLIRNSVVVIL